MKQFIAHTDVNADLATGWRVLTDFARYPEWNPLLRRVNGKCVLGASLGLRVARTPAQSLAQIRGGDKTIPLPAKIRVCVPETELAWGGGVPFLLDVHHFFRLTPLAGGFRFSHGENFGGPLITLLWPLIGSRVRLENYATLNEAFKARCELVMAGK